MSLLRNLTIVPAAHVNLTDLELQAMLYEVFHQDWRCRLSHTAMSPIIVTLAITLATRVHLVESTWLNGGLIVALGFWLSYALLDRLLAIVLFPVLLAMWAGGSTIEAAYGADIVLPGVIALVVAVEIQTWGHGVEALPPGASGTEGFVPNDVWMARAGVGTKAASFFKAAFVYPFLELWASPRVFAIQVLRGLFELGYRTELRDRINRQAQDILNNREPLPGFEA